MKNELPINEQQTDLRCVNHLRPKCRVGYEANEGVLFLKVRNEVFPNFAES